MNDWIAVAIFIAIETGVIMLWRIGNVLERRA
jgi:hypothetical protein